MGRLYLGVIVRFVVFLGVALALWAWRGRDVQDAPSASTLRLPGATFAVAWTLVYLCLALACALLGKERTPAATRARALILLAVALTWAWIIVRPASEAAGFIIIVAAIASLLAAFGLAKNAALLALPIAWLIAALVLSAT